MPLEHPHPYHPYGWYKWTPFNTLYYFILFNYLNHSFTFNKYPYHLSKTLKWVPLNITISLTFIFYIIFIKENRKAAVAMQYYGAKKKPDKMLLETVIPRHATGDVGAFRVHVKKPKRRNIL